MEKYIKKQSLFIPKRGTMNIKSITLIFAAVLLAFAAAAITNTATVFRPGIVDKAYRPIEP